MTRSMALRTVILVSVVCFVLVLLGSPARSQPRIKFEEPTYDWGQIKEGETVTHPFRFQNTGDEALIIERVKSG